MQNLFARITKVRMADWLVAAILLWALVAFVAPAQLQVSVYKMALVAIAAVAGYWIDRSLFPYARPDQYLEPLPDIEPAQSETAFTDLGGVVSFTEGVEILARDTVWLGIAAMARRAIIVSATMLAVSLGA